MSVSYQKRWGRRLWAAALAGGFFLLFFIAPSSFSPVPAVISTTSPVCYVNVYGFPGSGTSILHRHVVESLRVRKGGAAWFHDTGTVENEGFRLTFAIPALHSCFNSICSSTTRETSRLAITEQGHYQNQVSFLTRNLDTYICPSMLPKVHSRVCHPYARAEILQDWSQEWNVTEKESRFRIQKTPNWKLWILDACLPGPAEGATVTHVLSLRHPFYFRPQPHEYMACRDSHSPIIICRLLIWMNIWEHMFNARMFDIHPTRVVIVRYEWTLVSHSNDINTYRTALGDVLSSACGGENTEEGPRHRPRHRPRRRRLFLREDGVWNDGWIWSPSSTTLEWQKCWNDTLCHRGLEGAEDGVNAMGYSLLAVNPPFSARVRDVDVTQFWTGTDALAQDRMNQIAVRLSRAKETLLALFPAPK